MQWETKVSFEPHHCPGFDRPSPLSWFWQFFFYLFQRKENFQLVSTCHTHSRLATWNLLSPASLPSAGLCASSLLTVCYQPNCRKIFFLSLFLSKPPDFCLSKHHPSSLSKSTQPLAKTKAKAPSDASKAEPPRAPVWANIPTQLVCTQGAHSSVSPIWF